MKNLFSLFIFTMICNILFGQVSRQFEANAHVKGAKIVRYADKNPFPQFIQLEDLNIPADQIPNWLLANLNLPQGTSFKLLKKTSDKIGQTHYRFQQYYNNIPIEAGIYIAHCENNRVLSLNGELFDLSTTVGSPLLLEGDAVAAALSYVRAETYGWELNKTNQFFANIEFPSPELVFIPKDLDFKNPSFHLAYKMDIYAAKPHGRSWVYVDARTAQVIAEENRICRVEGTAETVYSGTQTIETEIINNTYRLHDTTRGEGIETYNGFGTGSLFPINLLNLDYFYDDDNYWDNPAQEQHGPDAHWGAQISYDYFLNNHNLNSYDGQGATIKSYVGIGNSYGSASWNGQSIIYGNGDTTGLSSPIYYPSCSPEVCAHELTHGVIQHSAGLIYSAEPGALNESFSDIFGLTIDFLNRPTQANWSMGDEITLDGTGFRRPDNPSEVEHPDTYLGFFWNNYQRVHINSSIQSHWFYLLVEGGSGTNDNGHNYSVQSIGLQNAANVAYRNLSVYLTPSSNYSDAAFYAAQAAKDLFGSCSSELTQVKNAWYAVGLYDNDPSQFSLDFEASDTKICHLPATIEFRELTNEADSVFWDFGGGHTSTDYSPLFTYTAEGDYSVTLIAYGCNGEIDTLVKENYITVDVNAPFCDTISMPLSGTILSTTCSGIITDDNLNNGDYSNNVNATIIIQSTSPITLSFIEFNLGFSDSLYIYDGEGTDVLLIGRYGGNQLSGDSILTSSGNSITINFYSNPYLVADGFVIAYNSFSDAFPVAGFEIPFDTIPFGVPVPFTSTAENELSWYWDFNDGSASTLSNPIHTYTSSGDYQVTQVVTNCLGADTVNQIFNVSSPPAISTYSPDSICVTLETGDTLSQFIILNNEEAYLYYNVIQDFNHLFTENSTEIYTNNGDSTMHLFDINSTPDTIYISVTLNGDFEHPYETADIYVEGILLGTMLPNPINNKYTEEFIITDTVLQNILNDGQLEVTIVNSSDVGVINNEDFHSVIISYYAPSWLSSKIETGSTFGENSINIPIFFDATGLSSNVYTHDLHIITNDPDYYDIIIPVKMTVLGEVLPTFTPNSLDFGEQAVSYTSTKYLTINNEGVDPYMISSISSSSPQFVAPTIDTILNSDETLIIPIEFTPNSVSNHTASLSFVTNTGDTSIQMSGIGIAPPIASFTPDSICLTLLKGQDTTQNIAVSNSGNSPLNCRISLPGNPIYTQESSIDYNHSEATTIHSFDLGVAPPDSVLLSITLHGDYESDNEYAEIFFGDLSVGQIEGGLNYIDITQTFLISGDLLDEIKVGLIDISVINSTAVDVYSLDIPYHSARLAVYYPSWITIPDTDENISINDTIIIPVRIDATELSEGIYRYNTTLSTSDPANPILVIPTKLIVFDQLISNFMANITFSCDGFVQFTDESQGVPTSWQWDFGDGATSQEQSPLHNYSTNGIYDVTLVTCNDLGCDTLTKTAYIQVDKLELSVTHPDTVDANESVTFEFNSDQNIISWAWDFSFTTSEEENPSISFPSSGIYTIILIATDDIGCTFNYQADIVILSTVGVESIEDSNAFNVYPNPSSGKFVLLYNNKNASICIDIFNSTGQLIYTENLSSTTAFIKKEMDLTNHPTGLYWIAIRQGDKLLTKKIIVQ